MACAGIFFFNFHFFSVFFQLYWLLIWLTTTFLLTFFPFYFFIFSNHPPNFLPSHTLTHPKFIRKKLCLELPRLPVTRPCRGPPCPQRKLLFISHSPFKFHFKNDLTFSRVQIINDYYISSRAVVVMALDLEFDLALWRDLLNFFFFFFFLNWQECVRYLIHGGSFFSFSFLSFGVCAILIIFPGWII